MSTGTRYTGDLKKQIVALYKSRKQVSKLSLDKACKTTHQSWIDIYIDKNYVLQ